MEQTGRLRTPTENRKRYQQGYERNMHPFTVVVELSQRISQRAGALKPQLGHATANILGPFLSKLQRKRKLGPILQTINLVVVPACAAHLHAKERSGTPRAEGGSISHVLREPQPVLPSRSRSPDAKYQWKAMPSMYCETSSSRTIASVNFTTATRRGGEGPGGAGRGSMCDCSCRTGGRTTLDLLQ